LDSAPGIAPSSWKLLRGRFARPDPDYPGIGDIITRSMVLGSRERFRETQSHADLYIRLPVDRWKMLDFKATSELVKVGYTYAKENISQWKQRLKI